MKLREIAENDLETTLEDDVNGFGISTTITDPAGTSASLTVQSGDVHLFFDAGIESRVSNRTAHIAIRLASLTTAGLGIPRPQPDRTKNPWIFEFPDAVGIDRKFTVSRSDPDRTLGIVTIILELLES
ncbi:MAG: hypothetical protein GY854_16545 [Deltaproteobacteria bacterium]|nr:hypothetical protein [Deltaproteobacteria bacterium]